MRISRAVLLILWASFPCHAQVNTGRAQTVAEPQSSPVITGEAERGLLRYALLADLRALEAEATELDNPVAAARAKTEVASALWYLDGEGAKRLLREAYEITVPTKEEKARPEPSYSEMSLPTPTREESLLAGLRERIIRIAGRDAAFAAELAKSGAERLGAAQGHQGYTALASQMVNAGDLKAAGEYINQAIEANPTLINAGLQIHAVAARDRAAADRLILQYINRLRDVRLPPGSGSLIRVHTVLRSLVFGEELGLGPVIPGGATRLSPASREVARAYVQYVLESVARAEREGPGGARRLRGLLLSVWLPLNRSAPDLVPAFLNLENLTRRSNEPANLPSVSFEEIGRRKREEQLRQALDSSAPDEAAVRFAIGRGDFDGARKLLDLFPEGALKTELSESADTHEVISLAGAGDVAGAERISARLRSPRAVLRAFPPLIRACAAKKDAACVSSLVHAAAKRMEDAEDRSLVPFCLSRLALAVSESDEALAFEVLDKAVSAANSAEAAADIPQAFGGVDVSVFRQLAKKNETRALQAAASLKDRLSRVAALAAIHELRAEKLKPEAAGGKSQATSNRE